ncbi:hypothetical protein [uncultured Thiodictyon sp.]|uniref:hypothetical protein n=1 Tax=uncultured Thiodictyon sp. TaxID=1846217 RepID=UPI0025D01EC7|nr:hypothetical protein [uncultured Thiodictyon sp.]
MGLDALLTTLESRAADTPDTRCNPERYQPKAAPLLGCTPDTCDTPQNDNAERSTSTAPNWRGFSLSDLEAAAGEDWPEVRDRPAALAALAGLLRTKAQRDRGEVPSHYTQASECATCGPVWLWQGAPAGLIACPWCLTRPKGAPTPRPPVVRDVAQ